MCHNVDLWNFSELLHCRALDLDKDVEKSIFMIEILNIIESNLLLHMDIIREVADICWNDS